MKRNVLLILLICSICFAACSKKSNLHQNIKSATDEKKTRFIVSIIGEKYDPHLFIELKDESKYTFRSPYGGYLWSSSDYKINGETISLSVMKEEEPFNIEELNKLFSSKNTNQYVDFIYDKDFNTFYFKGGYRNGNVGLFSENSESTPEGTLCMLGNTKVIKKSGYLVPVENLNVRREPSVKAEFGVIDYGYELLSLTEDEFRGTEMFNKDYAINIGTYQNIYTYQNIDSPVLLAGMIRSFSAVTVEKQTIDEITAPWYRISFTDNDEGGSRYYWIFGGYIKEIDNYDTKEYEQLFLEAAVQKGYLIPQSKINEEKQKAADQAKLVFDYADPLYKLSSKIEANHDRTAEKKGYYTIYYYNNNCTYSTVVELVNNDLLSSSKLKIGMTKQSVIDLLGQPAESSSDTIEYNTYEYTQGYGYELSFTIDNNSVSKIKIYFEK